MSRQKSINDYIDTKLNANNQSLPFKLYYKYGINDQEFSEFLLNSVDNGIDDPDNVIINFEGEDYNTQNGQYTIDNVNYIPCIIEDYQARFEPLSDHTIVKYTVPVSFFVEERFNRENNDIITDAIENVQDTIRGTTDTIGGLNAFIAHSDIRPISGLIRINEKPYRAYQMTFYFKMTNDGYFGEEIQYFIQNDALFSGTTTRIYPVLRDSSRNNELLPRQKFNDEIDASDEFEIKTMPDLSAFSFTLSLVYDGTELPRHFITQKYNPERPLKYFFSVVYPGMEGTPFGFDYMIESISGLESVDSQLIVTVTFKRASDLYSE